jgi:diaminohydroxyphosphoribosylaminopyrimidine deaminase/5-amino-6-(5-phosphoribosylamino)uracil reductase
VIVDGAFRVSPRARLFREGPAPLVITSREALLSPAGQKKAARLRPSAEVVAVAGREGRLAWGAVLALLGARDIQTVLVEGGATVAGGLIKAGLVDRVALFYGPLLLGGGLSMAAGRGRGLGGALRLHRVALSRVGPDWLVMADVDAVGPLGEGAKEPLAKGRMIS